MHIWELSVTVHLRNKTQKITICYKGHSNCVHVGENDSRSVMEPVETRGSNTHTATERVLPDAQTESQRRSMELTVTVNCQLSTLLT